MKKIFYCAAICLLAVTSCKSDDDNENLLVGTWKIDKYVVSYGNGENETDTPDACSAKSNIVFSNDNKVVGNDYFNDNSSCISETSNGTYSYDENSKNLTVTMDGESEVVKVEKLNSSELVIMYGEGDYDGDGKNDKEYIYYKK